MAVQKLISARDKMNFIGKFMMSSMFLLFFVSCRKDAITPLPVDAPVMIKDFKISTSRVILLQGNETHSALAMSWEVIGESRNQQLIYTVEAALNGTGFADPIELNSCGQSNVFLNVKNFNSKVLGLINAGNTGVIALRVRADNPASQQPPVYSEAVALEVTPYQPYKEYDGSQIIKIPGNFQDWKLISAPNIIAAGNTGEYEGYINFTNPYSQFLMVKGHQWNPNTTYSYIGANKFGFGGSMMSISGGAGIYLLKANTNTNTWAYTKINTWGLHGSAIYDVNEGNKDKVMVFDQETQSWSITTNLIKGDFIIRANNTNDINFGHNNADEAGVPRYNGESIHVTRAGKYTIKLSLMSAGNYAYGIQKS